MGILNAIVQTGKLGSREPLSILHAILTDFRVPKTRAWLASNGKSLAPGAVSHILLIQQGPALFSFPCVPMYFGADSDSCSAEMLVYELLCSLWPRCWVPSRCSRVLRSPSFHLWRLQLRCPRSDGNSSGHFLRCSSKWHSTSFTFEFLTAPESVSSPGTLYLKVGESSLATRTWNPSTLKVEAEFWGHPVLLTKTPSQKPAMGSWEVLVGKGACCPVWHMRGPTLWRVRTDFCIVTSDLQTRTTAQAAPNCSPPPHTQIIIALN